MFFPLYEPWRLPTPAPSQSQSDDIEGRCTYSIGTRVPKTIYLSHVFVSRRNAVKKAVTQTQYLNLEVYLKTLVIHLQEYIHDNKSEL